MNAKETYRRHCETQSGIPLFSQAWWLDAVAGEKNWNVCLIEKNKELEAFMPYVISKRNGFTLLTHPPLTQILGPWLKQPPLPGRESQLRTNEQNLMQDLIRQLPHYDHFQQSWHPTQTNSLPFFWKGFSVSLRYTYQLRNIRSSTIELALFDSNIRSDIRKATNKFGLRMKEHPNIADFIELNKKTFQRQNKVMPYSEKFLFDLDAACERRNARRIFIAEDENGNHHAGVYIVWNPQGAYYLMGGGDPELRRSGAGSLCLYEAIKFTATVADTFDFEGSMHEPIERFFRAFGAVQTTYLTVSHTPSKPLKILFSLKELFTRG